MKRALALALAGVAVVLVTMLLVMRGTTGDAANPTALVATERTSETATLTPATAAEPVSELEANDSRVAIDVGDAIDIHGRVIDELGRPIETFAIYAIHRDAQNKFSRKSEWPSATHVRGEFDLLALEPGFWDVMPFADHLSQPNIRSFAASTTERVEFVMRGLVSVSGWVVDPDGVRVGNARVFFEQRDTGVNADGEFQFEVAPGTYVVHAVAEGFAPSENIEIRASTGDRRADLQLVLKRGPGLRGVLLDEAGTPLRGWRLEANRERYPGLIATTDDRGGFEMNLSYPGMLDIVAAERSGGDTVPREYWTTVLASDLDHGTLTLQIARERSVRVTGTVEATAVREWLEHAQLTAVSLDGRLIRSSGVVVPIGPDARFEASLPSPGRYLFRCFGDRGIQLGSQVQIVAIPDRDEFELTLKFD